MFGSLGGSLLIIPVCYHPTTVLAVDDDIRFLKNLEIKVSDQLALLCFDKPEEALEYTKSKHHVFPFTSRCLVHEPDGLKLNFMAIRNEIYNPNRFKEIAVVVTDYDMPHVSGIELIKSMAFPPEISQFSHLILTGKISDDFKERIKKLGSHGEYIGKDEPDYVKKFLELSTQRSEKIFQWMSYIPARILSQNKHENNAFLFDGNFIKLFNKHLQENHICEFYLYDKQGSYVFLDAEANVSWLFIRNETGVQNTIKLAQEHGAPASVIDAIKTKKVILSLYEKEDVEAQKQIDWEKYLLPAQTFESNDVYLSSLPNLISEKNPHPQYYYTFAKDFPGQGIDKTKILSYKQFLEKNA